MTRILTDGAEHGNLVNVLADRYGTTINAGGRSGSYSYRALGASNTFYGRFMLPILASSEIFLRFSWYVSAFASYDYDIFKWQSDGTVLGKLVLQNSSKKILMYTSTGTLVATGNKILTTGVHYVFEMRIKIADSGGALEFRIDGIADSSYSGDTKPSTQTTINQLFFGSDRGTGAVLIDDVAVNNISGTLDNSWCNDGRIIMIVPNAEGDVTQLTPSSGSTNWSLVDERPPNDDTDYVSGSVVDSYDLYNLTSTGLSQSLHNVRKIIPIAYARDTLANGGKIQVGLKTSASEVWSEDITLITSYGLYSSGSQNYNLNPSTGQPWTVAEVDALQVGVKIRGT